MAKPPPRSAKEIIDDALRDNRSWEWLCYVLVVLLVGVGISILLFGIILERDVAAVVGGGVSGLFWPALRYARNFRQDNIRVRLYELPLAMSKSPEDAAMYLERAIGALKQPISSTGGSP